MRLDRLASRPPAITLTGRAGGSSVAVGPQPELEGGHMRSFIPAALLALALVIPADALAATASAPTKAGQPFPTNLYTVRDGTQITGLRVDLPTPDCPSHPSDRADIDDHTDGRAKALETKAERQEPADAPPMAGAGADPPNEIAATSLFTKQSIDARSRQSRAQLRGVLASSTLGAAGKQTVFPLS